MKSVNNKTCRVKFLPGGRQVEVTAGVSVIKAARLAGIHINASCGGSGVCGKCRVILESGTRITSYNVCYTKLLRLKRTWTREFVSKLEGLGVMKKNQWLYYRAPGK